MSPLYKVFVYGTLKKGEPNHGWFSKSEHGYHKFLYEARTKEKFPLIIGTRYNIPFLLHAPGKGHKVRGEVYEVDDKVLKDLDILEDHPDFYTREQHDVEKTEDSRLSEKVWIYFIKAYREELLEKPHLECYSNLGDHALKYVARYLREANYDLKSIVLKAG